MAARARRLTPDPETLEKMRPTKLDLRIFVHVTKWSLMIATDTVFRALGDPSRRRMLDLIKAEPGITVGQLSESFEFTRYGVMKHLKILNDAELVTSQRDGKHRRLYINVIPIQTIYDRWISQFSGLWAARLTSLKYNLENPKSVMTSTLKHRFVIYIRATADEVWHAITDPNMTEQYFHETRVECGSSVGESIAYKHEKNGEMRTALSGEILEIVAGKRLVHTFFFPSMSDAPSRLTYEIEESGELVKLTLTHDEFEGETDTYKGVSEGWPKILNGLKTLLETGRPLNIDFS